jgi:hypothetical protein
LQRRGAGSAVMVTLDPEGVVLVRP